MVRKRRLISAINTLALVFIMAGVMSLAHGGANAKAEGDIQVTGTVTNAAGTGVEDVSVYATDPGTDNVDYGPVTTASDGSYDLTVEAGTYDFHFDPANSGQLAPTVDSNVTVLNDQTIDIQVEPATNTFSTTVTDQNGNPVSNLDVMIGNASVLTNSAGSTSAPLPANSYSSISFGGGSPSTTISGSTSYIAGFNVTTNATEDLTSGNAAQNFALGFSALNITANDGSGNPESGARVFMPAGDGSGTFGTATVTSGGSSYASSVGEVYFPSATTDSNGTFNALVPTGVTFPANTLCVYFTDGVESCNSDSVTVSNSMNLNINEPATNTFSTTVTDQNGNPVSNLDVMIGNASVLTNSTGYTSASLPASVYNSVTFNGGSPSTTVSGYSGKIIGFNTTTTVPEDLTSGNAAQNFALGFSSLNITANNSSGNAESGATVFMPAGVGSGAGGTTNITSGSSSYASSVNNVDFSSVTTGSDGTFSILVPTGVTFPANTLCVFFTDGIEGCNSDPVSIASGTNLNINEPATNTFSTTVTDQNGNPISQVDVMIGNASVITNSAGSATASLPPNVYNSITFNGGSPHTTVSDFSGDIAGFNVTTNATEDLTSGNAAQNFALGFSALNINANNSSGSPEPGVGVYMPQGSSSGTFGTATVTSGGSSYASSVGEVYFPYATTNSNGTLDLLVPTGVTFPANTLCVFFSDGTEGCNTNAVTVSNNTNLNISEPTANSSPTITSPTSLQINARDVTSFQVTTTGTPTPTLTESGSLPTGLTFTDNGNGTATIAGQASTTNQGYYFLTITASNSVGSTSQNFVLSVNNAQEAPTFVSANNLTESYGVPFNFTVDTTGDPTPTISKLSASGSLPGGVTLKDNGDGTATLSGELANASDSGTYTFTLQAKNKNGSVSQPFTLTITKTPVIKTVSTKTATIGTSFAQSISASGDPTPSLSVSGLPAGLNFTGSGNGTGNITGTPTAGSAGTYTVTITASNSEGSSTSSFTLKVKS